MRIDAINKKVDWERLKQIEIAYAMSGEIYTGNLPHIYRYSARQGDIITHGDSREEVIKLAMEALKGN